MNTGGVIYFVIVVNGFIIYNKGFSYWKELVIEAIFNNLMITGNTAISFWHYKMVS
jgi:hypothetical protein